jgi:hypothetical protein
LAPSAAALQELIALAREDLPVLPQDIRKMRGRLLTTGSADRDAGMTNWEERTPISMPDSASIGEECDAMAIELVACVGPTNSRFRVGDTCFSFGDDEPS